MAASSTSLFDPDVIDSSLLLPSLERQSNALNLAYHYTRLIVYRPSLPSDLKKQSQILEEELQANVANFVNAPMVIATVAGRIIDTKQLFARSWVRSITAESGRSHRKSP